jgi:adenylate cyclase
MDRGINQSKKTLRRNAAIALAHDAPMLRACDGARSRYSLAVAYLSRSASNSARNTWRRQALALSSPKEVNRGYAMGDTSFSEDDLHVETTTIMFADVVESVQLIAQDELANVKRIRALFDHFANVVIPQYSGKALERRGDGVLVKFPSAKEACDCALALHRCAADQPASALLTPLSLRIGVHTAKVLTADDVLYGHGVNMAARIAALANPGETVASAAVREQLVANIDADIEDLGECYLKHLDAPVRAYRLDRAVLSTEPDPKMADQLRPTIAIIPPRMVRGTADDSFNSDVFADCVITGLCKTPELRVLSRLSSRAFQNRDFEFTEVRERLRADYALCGTAQFSCDTAILMLQLVSLADGEVMWAQQLKGSVASLLDSESELVGGVSSNIVSAILSAQIRCAASAKLPNLKSYSLLLAGIGLLHRQQFAEFDRARQLFQALSDRHPRHASPYAWLAAWRVFRVTQGWFEDIAKETSIATDLARRAVDADASDSLSHTVSGLVSTNLKRDFSAAQISFETALSTNKSEPLAWLHRGALKAFLGDGNDAVNDTIQARRLSPLDPWNYYFESLSASAAFAAGDYAQAALLARSSMRANRLHLSTLRVLVMASAELGLLDEARHYLREVLAIDPTLTVSKYLARSPSSGRHMAEICAVALRKAGLAE